MRRPASAPRRPPSPPGRTTQPLLDLPPGAAGRDLPGVDVRQILLGRLVDGARRGDYTLPGRLLHLQRAGALLGDLELPSPAHLGRDRAAARLVIAALDSQPLDPMGLCAEMHRARTDRLLSQEALELVRSATKQAEEAAVREAAEETDAIIAEHLRPAFHETMHRAGEAARRLGPYIDDEFRLDTARIITASLKVRNAYLALPDLVRRHSSILAARELANALGERPRSAIVEACVRSSSVHAPLPRRACPTTSSRLRRSPETTQPGSCGSSATRRPRDGRGYRPSPSRTPPGEHSSVGRRGPAPGDRRVITRFARRSDEPRPRDGEPLRLRSAMNRTEPPRSRRSQVA